MCINKFQKETCALIQKLADHVIEKSTDEKSAEIGQPPGENSAFFRNCHPGKEISKTPNRNCEIKSKKQPMDFISADQKRE